MDKKYLHKLLLQIYDREYELCSIYPSSEWKSLLDKTTDIVEKCIKEGVRDDD